ncbi:MAG: hypothetical protein NXI16_01220 [Alphaproteobacteria bacterium]|nr:hypothetical protein [Alphaproteobacteria bacterium]
MRSFRGMWQNMGGSVAYNSDVAAGKCRGMQVWSDDAGDPQIGIGTHTNIYVAKGGSTYDITPSGFTTGNEYGVGGTGLGWGAGPWGATAWGTAASLVAASPRTTAWAPWGEQALFVPRGENLYHWDGTVTNLATQVTTAPTNISYMFTTANQFVVALGFNPVTGTGFNPRLVGWADQGSYTDWQTTTENKAEVGVELQHGSYIVTGLAGRGINYIWTDSSLYAMDYIGASDPILVHRFDLLGRKCGCIGVNAAVDVGGAVYWMAPTRQFFKFDGGVPEAIRCDVVDTVFDELYAPMRDGIYGFANVEFNEVGWLYSSSDNTSAPEIDRYVVYNYEGNEWYTGTILGNVARTALDSGLRFGAPMAVTSTGRLVFQEAKDAAVDFDDTDIPWRLKTAPFDVGDGDRNMDCRRIVPDVDCNVPLSIRAMARRFPRGPMEFDQTHVLGVNDHYVDMMLQGRQMSLEYSGTGGIMRLGKIRADINPRGRHG